MINLDEYADIWTYWIALYLLNNDAIYFDNFWAEHVLTEIKKIIGNNNIETNIFRIEANKWI